MEMPVIVSLVRCRPHYFLTTKATPVTASAMPAMPAMLNASPNISQAMTAVVGGVRYNKLVTLVAALFRIKANNRKMAPIDNAKIAHSNTPTKCVVHYTVSSAGPKSSITIANGRMSESEAANWITVPVRKSKRGQKRF